MTEGQRRAIKPISWSLAAVSFVSGLILANSGYESYSVFTGLVYCLIIPAILIAAGVFLSRGK